jgi:type I restriction enzyme, R subunit
MKSRNFEILRRNWPELAALGGFAEAYAHADPASALVKLRLFAENLTKDIYRDLGLPLRDLDSNQDWRSQMGYSASSRPG